jgi:predicted PurR-regulated permease PerM
VFYPAVSFFFEIGVALIFVYPVWYFMQFLKKHVILEFTVATAILFVFAWLYSVVLEVFVSMVASGELSSVFSAFFNYIINRIETGGEKAQNISGGGPSVYKKLLVEARKPGGRGLSNLCDFPWNKINFKSCLLAVQKKFQFLLGPVFGACAK